MYQTAFSLRQKRYSPISGTFFRFQHDL
jgi:hypothetical protein